MSIPFSRSMRSLETDSSRSAVLGLLLVALLLIVWMAWLFLARITLYEVSATAHLVDDSRFVANFSPAVLTSIQPGQHAQLRLDDFPWAQYGIVPATVENIADQIQDGQVQVKFLLLPNPTSSIPFQAGLTGTVEVEVDHVSPAALVLRASGKFIAGSAR